jgi:hypothetical protein
MVPSHCAGPHRQRLHELMTKRKQAIHDRAKLKAIKHRLDRLNVIVRMRPLTHEEQTELDKLVLAKQSMSPN